MRLAILLVMMLWLPAIADTPKPKERLELTAKVAEIQQPLMICGRIPWLEVVRFEVISVEQGTWKAKTIYAVQLCPETLEVGQKLHLGLEKPAASDHYNDRFSNPSPRWMIRDSKRM